jgi:hypothetical protein
MLIKSLKLNLLKNNLIQSSKRLITVKKWRQLKGLAPVRGAVGPITDGPDWSYTDGRGFGPLTVGQKKRHFRDQEMAKTVVKYMKQFKIAQQLVPNNESNSQQN